MNKVSRLKSILSENLFWNKARLDCFAKLLLALFATRTVNLSELAVAFNSRSNVSSRYRRIQRFFALFKIDHSHIVRWIFRLFLFNDKKVYLLIDRTNWFWGKSKINVFMLAIAYEGLAVPLYWKLLPKAGSSCFDEQRELITRFIDDFGSECIEGVIGDREFASQKLFHWFNQQKIPFFIRIKDNTMSYINEQKLFTAYRIFKDLKPNEHMTFGMGIHIFGEYVYLTGSKSEMGELMIVASNVKTKNAISIYLRRWEIESLFQGLKSRGFRFEETHLTEYDRIEKLLTLLAVGFCWAHKVGEWVARKKPIILKKYRESYRPQNSFFRYGLNLIREKILSPSKNAVNFSEIIHLLLVNPCQVRV